jgi:light-regulated signal transduction histidine kinase (bacteriophytochrome)
MDRPSFFSDKKLLKNYINQPDHQCNKIFKPGNKNQHRNNGKYRRGNYLHYRRGIGIAEEDQLHMFSSFFRGANVTNIQGTGLGLHIVKRYIDLMGGSVQLKSKLDHGTTITFTIPVNQ